MRFRWLLDSAGVQIMNTSSTHASLVLMRAVFHSGVRLGHKIYLVDMVSQDTRCAYVTVIGVAMTRGGAVGVLADLFRTSTVIALLGVAPLLAAIYIVRMPDISG
jgi:hypothetical protein